MKGINHKKTIKEYRENANAGSTLITVIVAIAFVTILTSIILGSSVVNMKMRAVDMSTRDEFYYAERSLNDVFTGIGQQLAVIAGEEYEKSFEKVGSVIGGEDFNMAETAEKDFHRNFIQRVYTTVDGYSVASLQNFIQAASGGQVESMGAKEYQKKNGASCSASEADRVVIRDLEISATAASGDRTVITTDIVINVPTVDFLGTNADVSDYGLIANEGLYIKGGDSGCQITGNVYAGVHHAPITSRPDDGTDGNDYHDDEFTETTDDTARDGLYGGINIRDGKVEFDGNYIISKGDISLTGTNPKIKVKSAGSDANLANLWFTSIRTLSGASISDPATSPAIDVNANVFALNDMILNADSSSVVIKGNYYGYNENRDMLGQRTGRYDAQNSAIIVNGSKASLDMREINNFVLMGKAYIDFTSDALTKTGSGETPTQVVPTAESVALKTNQQLYLVPPDFLEQPNPDEGGTGSFTISTGADIEHWFGYEYLDTSVIHRPYKVTYNTLGGDTDVWYDYLEFDETKNWKPKRDHGGDIMKDPVYGTDLYELAPSGEALGTGGSISSKTKFFYDIMNARNAYTYAYDHTHGDVGDMDVYAKDLHGNYILEGGNRKKRTLDEYIEFKESQTTVIQPSAYRLYERINRSMDYEYFDLSQCVVGDTAHSDDSHYYAKNAVVNYERDISTHNIISNVLNNTDGMLRYATYSDYLYKRYIMLCTRLDGNEDILLEGDPAPGKGLEPATPPATGLKDWPEWVVAYPTPAPSDLNDKRAPICHFVKLSNIDPAFSISDSISAASAPGVNLKPGAYGVCIAQKGDLDLASLPSGAWTGDTFKGVAIVDGDITVPVGKNVEGLLMATGTITLKGNNRIHYDKGLLQSRIEKEMSIVKNSDESKANAYKNYYLINYLSKDDGLGGAPQLIYDVDPGTKIRRDRVEADFNEFMHYENWQKGER